jgi:EAL domain-containing protein (putative c-di-GMP-specific phosphodiesterase class I)
MTQPWEVSDATITFHVNVSIIELPEHAEGKDQVSDTMDFTLSEIKARHRQSIIIYSKRLMHLRQRRLDVLTALRNAITNESRVVVHYQPIFDTSNGHLVSAEALMRLQDDQLGLLMPGEFIPFAEKTGLIVNLTEIMLRKVCAFLMYHESVFKHLRHISINVSAEDFSTLDMSKRLLDIIDNSGVKASRLSFEMTESLLLESYETVKLSWGAFAQRGVTLALDDFGTGYSNLEALVNMPFDIVKIDRSVVSNSTNNFELITLISVVLERLGKRMIAEGVETQEQVEFVRAAGIDCMQGYIFSKPIPEEQFLDLLRYDNAK